MNEFHAMSMTEIMHMQRENRMLRSLIESCLMSGLQLHSNTIRDLNKIKEKNRAEIVDNHHVL